MNNNLEFLDRFLGSRIELYKDIDRLKSCFDSYEWEIVFDSSNVPNIKIDFNIQLSDRSLLTEEKNSSLLLTIKYWVIASLHPDNTRGRGITYSDSTASNIVVHVLYVIDYLLLRDDYFELHKFGLEALTKDDMFNIASEFYSSNKKHETVYKWSELLSQYLKGSILKEKNTLDILIQESKIDFFDITNEQKNGLELDISDELIPYAKAWLYKNSLYSSRVTSDYQFQLHRKKLSQLIYSGKTLRGAVYTKPNIEILSIEPREPSFNEFQSVPVKNYEEGTATCSTVQLFNGAIKVLLSLHDESLQSENLSLPPISVINSIKKYVYKPDEDRRTATLPSSIILKSVRDAIEFHYEYADSLISSLDSLFNVYAGKLENRTEAKRNSLFKVLNKKEFKASLDQKIKKLGVSSWSLPKGQEKAHGLRNTPGLANLLGVYYGGTAVVVGAIMARREIELRHLRTKTCLDNTKNNLIFKKAKSTKNLAGLRELVARPVDKVAVDMITNLQKIQQIYMDYGFIDELSYLFLPPSLTSAENLIDVSSNGAILKRCIDAFCDYFETPLKDGKRYYIRIHQLRRFFALSFFWGNGFGGLDTLRWFMGHTDPEHVYRYISESLPGDVLRHAKSQFVSETIEEHDELRKLISKTYNTDDFTLLTEAEIEAYIDELIKEEAVEVEPEFIETDEGKIYRILVIIREKVDA